MDIHFFLIFIYYAEGSVIISPFFIPDIGDLYLLSFSMISLARGLPIVLIF